MNNIDKQKLIDAIVASSDGKLDREKLNNAANTGNISGLMSSLSNEERQKLAEALSDNSAAGQLLQSPQARAILNAFLKGGSR